MIFSIYFCQKPRMRICMSIFQMVYKYTIKVNFIRRLNFLNICRKQYVCFFRYHNMTIHFLCLPKPYQILCLQLYSTSFHIPAQRLYELFLSHKMFIHMHMYKVNLLGSFIIIEILCLYYRYPFNVFQSHFILLTDSSHVTNLFNLLFLSFLFYGCFFVAI